MMKLSGFLGVILIVSTLVLSSSSFVWKPFLCETEDELRGLELKYLVFDVNRLYFYYPTFVVRALAFHLDWNTVSREVLTNWNIFVSLYGEAEYANYSDMTNVSNFIDKKWIAFYQVQTKVRCLYGGCKPWLTYALRRDGGKNKVNEVIFEEGQFAG